MQDLLSALNTIPGYFLIGLIAYCDTLIGVGFFVFGEAAFLAAGAALAASGKVLPIVIVLICSWAGDLSSYWIGRRYGASLSLRYLKHLKRRRAWRRARSALHKRGVPFVIISRLLGPTAWITPFLAGSMHMKPVPFAIASALGVAIGVGQFILLGAIGLQVLPLILPFLGTHAWSVVLFIVLLIAGVFIWRRAKGSYFTRLSKALGVALILFLSSNLLYFFALDSHNKSLPPKQPLASVCEASSRPFLVYPGDSPLHLPQPVNILLLSDQSGAALMTALGWHQNQTFSQNEIGFTRFLHLLWNATPPVSELTLESQPADSAFQMPGTIKQREHIRWWDLGAGVSFGAISRDDELAIKYYRHLPVLLHDIDPYVDHSRDLLASQVAASAEYDVIGFAKLSDPVPDGVIADYQTDGKVLIVADHGKNISPEIMECLKLPANS